MSEHYPKSTVEVTEWCKRCGKHTMHKVYDGRVQSCLVCLEASETKKPARREPLKGTQLDLFGGETR